MIDNINNDNVLAKFYDILIRVKESSEGSLWERLSPDEQEELINIENESHNPENLIPQSEMVKKHKK